MSTSDRRGATGRAGGDGRVTVFVPTYNRAGYLGGAIESVLGQTFGDFRLVVADNSSTDETPDVVARYTDPRLEYVRRPANLGLVGNWSACLEAVETEYAIIVGDDDVPYPMLLEETVAALDGHPSAGMVHAAFDVIGPAGEVLERGTSYTMGLTEDTVETGRGFIRESMRWWCRVCPSTALIRVDALPERPFDPADHPGIDFGLWLRIAADWDVAFLARPLVAYRVHPKSETAAQFGTSNEAHRSPPVAWIVQERNVKLRFLEEQGDRLPEVRSLRKLAEDAARTHIIFKAREATLPQRRPLATIRSLGALARSKPGILAHSATWRLLVASVLGPRLVERMKRRRRTALSRSGR